MRMIQAANQRTPAPAAAAAVRYRPPLRVAVRTHTPAAATVTTCNDVAVPQQLLVRPVTASDRDAWWALFRESIEHHKARVSDDTIGHTWERLMAGGGVGSHTCLVAEETSSGRMLGFAHMLLHPSTWHSRPYCYLEDLFVDQEVRNAGVGQALMQAVFRSADQQGACKVYWTTAESNVRAHALYDKVGSRAPRILYERK